MNALAKPSWIRRKWPQGQNWKELRSHLSQLGLSTVCSSAQCPNQAECWAQKSATLMVMGRICTRSCRFCAVSKGTPKALDHDEPEKVARWTKTLKLDYLVLTSVDRDDLRDGGALHLSRMLDALARECPQVKVELLIPDFQGELGSLQRVVESSPDVLGHNLETVERLTPSIRDHRASYSGSLRVLAQSKIMEPKILTKSSLILGLGETLTERLQALQDLRNAGVDWITLGQYLQPTKKNLPVAEFLTPEHFDELRTRALEMGFRAVVSGPMVRSSYRAFEYYKKLCPL